MMMVMAVVRAEGVIFMIGLIELFSSMRPSSRLVAAVFVS